MLLFKHRRAKHRPPAEDSFSPSQTTQEKGLSNRQKRVLELLAAGKTYNQVGEELFIEACTVQTHLKNASETLGTDPKTLPTVVEALRRNLIQFPSMQKDNDEQGDRT